MCLLLKTRSLIGKKTIKGFSVPETANVRQRVSETLWEKPYNFIACTRYHDVCTSFAQFSLHRHGGGTSFVNSDVLCCEKKEDWDVSAVPGVQSGRESGF